MGGWSKNSILLFLFVTCCFLMAAFLLTRSLLTFFMDRVVFFCALPYGHFASKVQFRCGFAA